MAYTDIYKTVSTQQTDPDKQLDPVATSVSSQLVKPIDTTSPILNPPTRQIDVGSINMIDDLAPTTGSTTDPTPITTEPITKTPIATGTFNLDAPLIQPPDSGQTIAPPPNPTSSRPIDDGIPGVGDTPNDDIIPMDEYVPEDPIRNRNPGEINPVLDPNGRNTGGGIDIGGGNTDPADGVSTDPNDFDAGGDDGLVVVEPNNGTSDLETPGVNDPADGFTTDPNDVDAGGGEMEANEGTGTAGPGGELDPGTDPGDPADDFGPGDGGINDQLDEESQGYEAQIPDGEQYEADQPGDQEYQAEEPGAMEETSEADQYSNADYWLNPENSESWVNQYIREMMGLPPIEYGKGGASQVVSGFTGNAGSLNLASFDPTKQLIEQQRDAALRGLYESAAARGMGNSGFAAGQAGDIYRNTANEMAGAYEKFREARLGEKGRAADFLAGQEEMRSQLQQQRDMANLSAELSREGKVLDYNMQQNLMKLSNELGKEDKAFTWNMQKDMANLMSELEKEGKSFDYNQQKNMAEIMMEYEKEGKYFDSTLQKQMANFMDQMTDENKDVDIEHQKAIAKFMYEIDRKQKFGEEYNPEFGDYEVQMLRDLMTSDNLNNDGKTFIGTQLFQMYGPESYANMFGYIDNKKYFNNKEGLAWLQQNPEFEYPDESRQDHYERIMGMIERRDGESDAQWANRVVQYELDDDILFDSQRGNLTRDGFIDETLEQIRQIREANGFND